MESEICETCAHFIQHYGKLKGKYYPLGCGHCIALRVKRCAPENPACGHYKQREARESGTDSPAPL